MGYGAQWSEVVMMAQNSQKDAAVKKYMSFSNVSESDAKAMVDSLAGAQTYEFTPGTGYNAVQIAPITGLTRSARRPPCRTHNPRNTAASPSIPRAGSGTVAVGGGGVCS